MGIPGLSIDYRPGQTATTTTPVVKPTVDSAPTTAPVVASPVTPTVPAKNGTGQYTVEEIGARVRSRKPDVFTNFTDTQIGERVIQRKPELQKLVKEPVTSNVTPTDYPSRNGIMGKILGLGGDIAKAVAKPIVDTGVTAVSGLEGLGSLVTGVGGKEANRAMTEGYNVPFLGQTKPVSLTVVGPDVASTSPTDEIRRVAGTGAELASLAMGGKASGEIAGQVAKSVGLNTAKKMALEGAIIGGAGSAGQAMSDPNKHASDIAKATALGVAGGAAFGAVSPTVAKYGQKMLGVKSSPIVMTRRMESKLAEYVSPTLNQAEKAAAISRGRGAAPTLFSESSILPGKYETEMAKAVAGVIDIKASKVTNVEKINSAIAKEADKVIVGLKKHNAIFNTSQIKAKFDSLEKPLLLVSDQATSNAYERAVDTFMTFIDEQPKNLSGLLQARKNFDSWVERQVPHVFDDEKVNALRSALRDVRNSANDFIASKLPVKSSFRSSLRRQSLMYDVRDNLAEKAAKEVGKGSKVQMFMKKNQRLVDFGLGAAGLGAAGTAYKIMNE